MAEIGADRQVQRPYDDVVRQMLDEQLAQMLNRQYREYEEERNAEYERFCEMERQELASTIDDLYGFEFEEPDYTLYGGDDYREELDRALDAVYFDCDAIERRLTRRHEARMRNRPSPTRARGNRGLDGTTWKRRRKFRFAKFGSVCILPSDLRAIYNPA